MNRTCLTLALALLAAPAAGAAQNTQPQTLTLGGFSFEQSIIVPGTSDTRSHKRMCNLARKMEMSS